MTKSPEVVFLQEHRKLLAIDVLVKAFHDYPVMRHVIDRDSSDYPSHLQALVGLFVGARISRGAPILAVESEGAPIAVATLTLPGEGPPGAEYIALRERVWGELGAAARARYEALGEAWSTFEEEAAHYHVNMIGVQPDHQGRGLARVLLNEVHRLSSEDPTSSGVSLSTESSQNVPFYQHLGYSITATMGLAEGLRTWGFFRRDA